MTIPGANESAVRCRDARPSDAEALLGIYTPYVLDTPVSFETEPPDLEEFRGRVERALERWAWVVIETDGEIAGYAYGSSHRARPAYQWAVETSIYIAPGHHRRGFGSRLYRFLFERLAARGFCNAYAGTTVPNDASIAMHRSLGFEPIGVFRRVGFKDGRWHDVSWSQLDLRAHHPQGPDAPPGPLDAP